MNKSKKWFYLFCFDFKIQKLPNSKQTCSSCPHFNFWSVLKFIPKKSKNLNLECAGAFVGRKLRGQKISDNNFYHKAIFC